MNPRQFDITQPANAPQPFEALLRCLHRPHHTDVKRLGAHRFHHCQVINARIVGQCHHRRIAMAAAIGDEHRGQLATDLHALQHNAFEHLVARITEDHFKAQAHGKLRAGVRHAGIPGQQQTLSRADAQSDPVDLTLDPHALLAIIEQTARAAGQIDFADQPASTQQRRLQPPQMRLLLATGLELLHQHIEHAATGQAHPRARVIAFAVANDADRLLKGALGDALKEVLLDAAAGQRSDPQPFGIHRQQRARRSGRRAVGGEHGAQPDALTGRRPLQSPAHHLQVEMLHVSAPCARAAKLLPAASARRLPPGHPIARPSPDAGSSADQ